MHGFEDDLAGVCSGKAAGCVVVAVAHPFFVKEQAVLVEEVGIVLSGLEKLGGAQFRMPVDMTRNVCVSRYLDGLR